MITDLLDLLGSLLLILAVSLWVGSLAGLIPAVVFAGVTILVFSYLLDRPRKGKQ